MNENIYNDLKNMLTSNSMTKRILAEEILGSEKYISNEQLENILRKKMKELDMNSEKEIIPNSIHMENKLKLSIIENLLEGRG